MLWFRTFWTLITARFRPAGAITDEYRLTCHCLPTDIDANRHMNNSRYHIFLDLARIELYVRSGIWPRVRAEDASTVVGTSSIRFRKEIRAWQRFDITARILSWDDRWIYVEHRFLTKDGTAAIAVVKSAIVDKNGRISPDRMRAIMGHAEPPPFTNLVAAQNTLDSLLKA